eukprot:443698_1
MTQQITGGSCKLIDTESIIKIINEHSTITNAVNALSQQLPFDKQICHNMILQLMKQHHDIKLTDDKDEHKNDTINEETDVLLAGFNDNEFNELKAILTSRLKSTTIIENEHQSSDFRISWTNIIKCVRHEMWPVLASTIQAIINDEHHKEYKKITKKIDLYDLSENTIKLVIGRLKTERYLGIEPRQYLNKLIERAKKFSLTNQKQNRDISDTCTDELSTDLPFSINEKQWKLSVLRDVFDVHRAFVFSNFHFREYTVDNFKEDIMKNGVWHLGQTFIENIQFNKPYNLYPNYLVNDDMFSIFNYHFGISYYINYLKNNLNINNGSHFILKSFVIPKSVSCIYDENKSFNYTIGYVAQYLLNVCSSEFYKIPVNSHQIQSLIKQIYNIDDIKKCKITKLMLIIDTRRLDNDQYDEMYIFPFQNEKRLTEMYTNYFIGFEYDIRPANDHALVPLMLNNLRLDPIQSTISYSNYVITRFHHGIMQKIRFYPEMLTNVIPRLFVKPVHLSEAQFLDKEYDHVYKHGFCVTLNDPIFNRYYKIITGLNHESVNYNRNILYD